MPRKKPVHENSLKNLRPNVFSSENQPKKRRGPETLATVLRKSLNRTSEGKQGHIKYKNAIVLNKRTGKPTGKLCDVLIPIDDREGMIAYWVNKAMGGNDKLFELMVAYDAGKPVESHKMISEDGDSGINIVVLK